MEWLSDDWFWKVFLTSSVVAAGITIGVNRVLKYWDDRALRSATKQAIQAEIDYASMFGVAYLTPDSMKLPMHRITTAFHDEGVPKLVALGALNYEATQALLQYYGNIDQMNRSLDLAQSLQGAARADELGRTLYKACSLASIRDLRRLADMERDSVIETVTIRMKSEEYGDEAPYDRVKRLLGLV